MSILDKSGFFKTKFIVGFTLITSVASFQGYTEEVPKPANKYDLSSYTAKQAYEAGKLMRAQFKDSLARPYLKYAADKGDLNAAYLYAMDMVSDNPNFGTSDLAKKYLIQAANGGQMNATYYLYKYGSWFRNAARLKYRTLYHDGAVELAENNPGKASYDLYLYYRDLSKSQANYYLKKSKEYAYPQAVLQSSIQSYNEQSNPNISLWFIKDVENIANDGFIPAVRSCIDYYESREQYDQALRWKEVALKYGDLMSLASLAKIYAGLVPSYQFVKPDLIKSYAYLSMYIDNAGKNRFSHLYGMMENLYSDISDKMTKKQKEKANSLTDDYKSTVVFYSYDTLWDI